MLTGTSSLHVQAFALGRIVHHLAPSTRRHNAGRIGWAPSRLALAVCHTNDGKYMLGYQTTLHSFEHGGFEVDAITPQVGVPVPTSPQHPPFKPSHHMPSPSPSNACDQRNVPKGLIAHPMFLLGGVGRVRGLRFESERATPDCGGCERQNRRHF